MKRGFTQTRLGDEVMYQAASGYLHMSVTLRKLKEALSVNSAPQVSPSPSPNPSPSPSPSLGVIGDGHQLGRVAVVPHRVELARRLQELDHLLRARNRYWTTCSGLGLGTESPAQG